MFADFWGAFDEFGGALGVGLDQELGDEFGADFDEFAEIGPACFVFSLHLEMRLMSLGVRLMSLGVG